MPENYDLPENLQTQINSLFAAHETMSSSIQDEFYQLELSHVDILNKYFDGLLEDFESFKSVIDFLKTNRMIILKQNNESLEIKEELNNNLKYLHPIFLYGLDQTPVICACLS